MDGRDYAAIATFQRRHFDVPSRELMKPIQHLAFSLALALSFPAAGETIDIDKSDGKAGARGARRAAVAAAARQAEINTPGELSGEILYQVLLAEMALQRGRAEFASQNYYDLATRTNDPGIIARAVEIAGHARRTDRALELAKLWIQVDPDSKRAQHVLINVMVLTNQFDGLAPLMIRTLEADKESLPANLLAINRLFARTQDKQAVLQLMNKVSASYATLPEAHYAVAVAAATAGETSQAQNEARKALELRPGWEAAALLEAQILAQQSMSSGIESIEKFLVRYPQSRDARLYLARALIGEKRYPEAKHHFEQLLVAYPNTPEVVYPVAILALQEKDRPLAQAQLKHLLTLDVQDKSTPNFYLGQLADEDKRREEAIDYYRRVTLGEYFLTAQLRIAKLLADDGKLDLARSHLRDAAENNPTQRTPLIIGEAALLRDAKQHATALALLDQRLAADPEQPDLLYESALLAEKLGRLDLTESRLRKLLVLQPDNAHAYNALGYSFAERNINLPEARQLIEKALQLAPEDPFILDSLGWVMYRQGDLEGALAKLERAHTLRADPEIAAHIGEILWRLGRVDDARRTFREALKKDPDNEVLSEAARKFSR